MLLAAALGCKANCRFCVHAGEDYDGDYGQLFCGTVCGAGKAGEETYLEDAGVDTETEKACWEPDFWSVPGDEFCDLIGDDGNPERAYRAFEKKVARLRIQLGGGDAS